MSSLRELKSQILAKGTDGRIDDDDVALLRKSLPADGRVAPEDLTVLVELRSEARTVCPAFDQLLFPALREHVLADGVISLVERFHLLRMLYGGGGVDEAEKRFLRELRRDVKDSTPEFDALCQLALDA